MLVFFKHTGGGGLIAAVFVKMVFGFCAEENVQHTLAGIVVGVGFVFFLSAGENRFEALAGIVVSMRIAFRLFTDEHTFVYVAVFAVRVGSVAFGQTAGDLAFITAITVNVTGRFLYAADQNAVCIPAALIM